MSDPQRRREEREARAFGVTLVVVGVALALWRLGGAAQAGAMAAAALLALVAWRRPAVLVPASRVAGRLARAIGRVTTPVGLAMLHLGVVVPLGLLLRVARVDPMGRRRAPSGASYWRTRRPAGFSARDFERMS